MQKEDNDDEALEKLDNEALKQIEEKKYEASLKSRGIDNIVKLGIAYCDKNVKVSKG